MSREASVNGEEADQYNQQRIDDAKRTAEQNELLSRELSHRIKNIFQVVTGLISLTARRAGPEVKAFASELRDRVGALGRAHEFARPHSEESRPVFRDTSLDGMLHELFAHPPEKGFLLAQEVDEKGRAIVLTTSLEHAELKQEQIHAYGPDPRIERCKGSMTAELEPAE